MEKAPIHRPCPPVLRLALSLLSGPVGFHPLSPPPVLSRLA